MECVIVEWGCMEIGCCSIFGYMMVKFVGEYFILMLDGEEVLVVYSGFVYCEGEWFWLYCFVIENCFFWVMEEDDLDCLGCMLLRVVRG